MSDRVGLLTRIGSVLCTPVAPLAGAFLAYSVFHPPRRRHHRTPADFDLPFTELTVPVGSGGSLDVWLCAGDPDRVVVVGHGIGLSKSASLAHAKFLHDAGYTVALLDHRNHGRSSQDRTSLDLTTVFTSDVAAVVGHLRAQPAHTSAAFAVYGFSFSTFPVLYVPMLADDPIAAIICDSGPALERRNLFRNFLDAGALPVPGVLLAQPARTAVAASFAASTAAMTRSQWPPPVERYRDTALLFLGGEKDRIVPSGHVAAIAGVYPHAEFREIPGAEHLQGIKADPELYRETVLAFLKQALG